MIRLNVEIDHKPWNKKIKDPKKYFSSKLKKISKKLNYFIKKKITLTILLTNSSRIKKLNKKFRKKNKPTDALSFPNYSKKINILKKKELYIGDIAISYEIINSRSKTNNFFEEFDKVWIHGFLHLVGYDHIKNKDYLKMNKLEKKILNAIR
jgi:probable rRNA maturation factor